MAEDVGVVLFTGPARSFLAFLFWGSQFSRVYDGELGEEVLP